MPPSSRLYCPPQLTPVRLLLAIALNLSLLPSFALANLPSQTASPAAQPLRLAQLRFTVPNIRPSRRRTAGFSRGTSCIAPGQSVPFTALTPKSASGGPSEPIGEIPVELTVSDRPTFFVYIPKTTAASAELILTNDSGTEFLTQSSIPLTGEAGVVGITLPPQVNLQENQTYQWSIALVCDPDDPSSNLLVDGWVERRPLDRNLAAQLAAASPSDRPALYASAGLWQDTLAAIATLRFATPRDPRVTADWESLLNSVNLGQFTQTSIVQIAQGNF